MMKDEEKALKLRPLSIGSMELMQRFNCIPMTPTRPDAVCASTSST